MISARRTSGLLALLVLICAVWVGPAEARARAHRHHTLVCRTRRHHRVCRRVRPMHLRRLRVPAGKPRGAGHGQTSSGTSTTSTSTSTSTSSVTSGALSSTASASGTASGASTTPSFYWGAGIGPQFTGDQAPWDMNALSDFENRDAGGKQTSIVAWGSNWHSSAYCNGYCNFTTSLYGVVRDNGQIPWLSWQSTDTDGGAGYTDSQIADGSQDAYITQWAEAAKAWGHPLFLRFDWEMNGNWFPWSPGVDGNTAASYVAMWRHVHDIFTRVGATNVSWVWCPNVDPGNSLTSLASLYPGSSYVDWTCLDGYNGDVPWTSFKALFQSTYDEITSSIAPGKPMIVGETASTENGGSKATWITDMFSALPTSFPDIHGLLWYDASTPGPGGYTDWPIESSSSSIAAFTAGIASPLYATNNYANLNASPIPAPNAA